MTDNGLDIPVAAVTYNGFELPLVLISRCSVKHLLQQVASLGVRFSSAFEVLSIVELNCGVGLLQGTGEHRLL
jgi:hypothetical protein